MKNFAWDAGFVKSIALSSICDLIIMAIGVRLMVDLVKGTEIKVNKGILVA